jgi:hypothetical protein
LERLPLGHAGLIRHMPEDGYPSDGRDQLFQELDSFRSKLGRATGDPGDVTTGSIERLGDQTGRNGISSRQDEGHLTSGC